MSSPLKGWCPWPASGQPCLQGWGGGKDDSQSINQSKRMILNRPCLTSHPKMFQWSDGLIIQWKHAKWNWPKCWEACNSSSFWEFIHHPFDHVIFRLGISSRLQPSALASSQYPACPECPPHWKAPNETCLSLEDLRRSQPCPPGRLKLEHVTLLIPYHGMPFWCEASLEKLCKTGRGERQWNVNPQASRLNLALHSIPRVGSVKIMRIVRKDVMDTAFQLQRS